MEKLWSPWRSNYIESFKDQTGDEDCIFCNAVHQNSADDSSLVILHEELCFVTLNLYPYNGGHLMVIPNRHLSDFNKLEADELLAMMSLVQKSMKALDLVMKPHGYNLGANIGRAAGAGIDQHIHFHIVPRWSGDSNFMPVIGEVKVISQDLLHIKKDLVAAFEKINN